MRWCAAGGRAQMIRYCRSSGNHHLGCCCCGCCSCCGYRWCYRIECTAYWGVKCISCGTQRAHARKTSYRTGTNAAHAANANAMGWAGRAGSAVTAIHCGAADAAGNAHRRRYAWCEAIKEIDERCGSCIGYTMTSLMSIIILDAVPFYAAAAKATASTTTVAGFSAQQAAASGACSIWTTKIDNERWTARRLLLLLCCLYSAKIAVHLYTLLTHDYNAVFLFTQIPNWPKYAHHVHTYKNIKRQSLDRWFFYVSWLIFSLWCFRTYTHTHARTDTDIHTHSHKHSINQSVTRRIVLFLLSLLMHFVGDSLFVCIQFMYYFLTIKFYVLSRFQCSNLAMLVCLLRFSFLSFSLRPTMCRLVIVVVWIFYRLFAKKSESLARVLNVRHRCNTCAYITAFALTLIALLLFGPIN